MTTTATESRTRANIPRAVEHLVDQYRRFLRTSYRFLDEDLRVQFEQHLAQADVVVRGPYVTLSRDFVRGRRLAELVEAGEAEPELQGLRWAFGAEPLFQHQEISLTTGRAGRPFVVTTGTGSGKTESFLLPVFDGILRRKREGVRGVQAVLLYPMNALANDQLERLRRMLRGTGVDLSFGMYTGTSDASSQSLSEEPAETERVTRAQIKRDPPDVLLTNYKQLEFLLVRPDDRALFTPSLRYLVLDELHSYRGALATEIACLIRRLKAHAGLRAGELLGIGTSATVASGEDGRADLARFATSLYGERFDPADVIGENVVPHEKSIDAWLPPAPSLSPEDVLSIDPASDDDVVALAERLTARRAPTNGAIADRVAACLRKNALVEGMEAAFSRARSIGDTIESLRASVPGLDGRSDDELRTEVEAYLLVGSVGDDENPPRLRPKLHTFFHGVYDVALCLDPDCRTLVPHGAESCGRCGAAARPAALCRTCGQDFVKVRFQGEDDERPLGTGDFFSDENTGFLTHGLHELPEGVEDDADDGEETGKAKKPTRAAERLQQVGVCCGCGSLGDVGSACLGCGGARVSMLLHRGGLNTCPACGDVYTRGDIVTPLRTGTASTVSVITHHHLDHLERDDRKVLVFSDNRQDAAHQAGYTADKQRTFALRHVLVQIVREAGPDGLDLEEAVQRALDLYRKLGITRKRKLTRDQQKRWLEAIRWEVANEVTRYSRQRASLENLGLLEVDYEFLPDVAEDADFAEAREAADLDESTALLLVRAILDVVRKNRALAYDFFQEYVDPNKKSRYRRLEEEPYRLRFPDRDRSPKAFALDRPDHIRASGRLMGFYQENPKAGQLTAPHKLAKRVIGDRARAEEFVRAVVPLLEKHGILVHAKSFPIPAKELTARLRPLQIDPSIVRLSVAKQGWRCNACRTWRAYRLDTCPTPKCSAGRPVPDGIDEDNYYVRLYCDREPQRLIVQEHSAQIDGEERARRETEFKKGFIDGLVCTPTLELGVDVGPLLNVVLRNAPPTPANYAQRVGRAGRRLRIGFTSTFCAGGSHDRNAFEHPEWLIAGRFDPPTVRLDNFRIVHRHLRSHVLESLTAGLPVRMGDLLDDLKHPTRWQPEKVQALFEEIGKKRVVLVTRLADLLARDREEDRTARYDSDECSAIVDGFERDLSDVLNRWWRRVEQLDKEFREFSTIGSPRQDKRKAEARSRAYREITTDPERSYVLNYLSTQDFLPAYQFPLDSFSLDPGVADTPTLFRPASIAIEEFAPGNYVYANGHKLQSIRVLFAGGPGSSGGDGGRSDAETSGRVVGYQFCEHCGEAVEATRNSCPRCKSSLGAIVDTVFVTAFEAEENYQIGSEEESRQRIFYERREHLLLGEDSECQLFEYPIAPIEYHRLGQVLVTNWGRSDSKTGEGRRFSLCPECGRHRAPDASDPAKAKQVKAWDGQHAKFCAGEVAPLVLGHKFQTDCLILNVPGEDDREPRGKAKESPTMVTLAQSLLAGASALLEIEPFELSTFVRSPIDESAEEQIVLYENVPGGAGYLEEMARRLPEVAAAAMERVFGHDCQKACYLCLKHYRNQRWHAFFAKERVQSILLMLSTLERVEPRSARMGAGLSRLSSWIEDRGREVRSGDFDSRTGRYRRGAIEEPLWEALLRIPDLPRADREFECEKDGRLVTVPDFTWPDVKLAVYCDGYAFHGDRDTLELDARKRNWLQSQGWTVLTYWGRTILADPETCAQQIASTHQALRARRS